MRTRTRTNVDAAADRRARAQAEKWGDEVRTMRLQHGLTIQAAADRAGVAWKTWLRVEAGEPSAGVGTLCRIGEAIGLDLVLQAYIGRPPSLRDTGQLEIAAWLRSEADGSLKSLLEVGVGTHGQSIDLVMFGPTEILRARSNGWRSIFRLSIGGPTLSAASSPIAISGRSGWSWLSRTRGAIGQRSCRIGH